ncbi:aldo/keto reductase [Haematococcus lacustris]
MAPRRHKLGNSDLEVPCVCLGTMTWGSQNTEEEAFAQLDYALANGVDFIDTAEMYPVPPDQQWVGRTEEYIGRWMEARGVRSKVILATKVSSFPGPNMDRSMVSANRTDPPTPNAAQPELDAASIRQALEGSLRRLRTTYIDLYQLHWPNRYAPLWGARQYDLAAAQSWPKVADMEEQVATIGELIKEGKIRYWGLSNETTFGVCRMVEIAKRLGVPPPISIQNDFSLCYRYFEGELAEACAPCNHNIGLLAWGVLAGGALTDKYLSPQGVEGAPAEARHRKFPAFQKRYVMPRVLEAAKEYAGIAKAAGLTAAQMAVAWSCSRWYMGSVIIGATNMQQLKENIEASEITLSAETLAAIDEVHVRRRNPECLD